jgi:hypothetical protein
MPFIAERVPDEVSQWVAVALRASATAADRAAIPLVGSSVLRPPNARLCWAASQSADSLRWSKPSREIAWRRRTGMSVATFESAALSRWLKN